MCPAEESKGDCPPTVRSGAHPGMPALSLRHCQAQTGPQVGSFKPQRAHPDVPWLQGRQRTSSTTPPSAPEAALPSTQTLEGGGPQGTPCRVPGVDSRLFLLSPFCPRLCPLPLESCSEVLAAQAPPLLPLPAASQQVGKVPRTPSRVKPGTHLFPSM